MRSRCQQVWVKEWLSHRGESTSSLSLTWRLGRAEAPGEQKANVFAESHSTTVQIQSHPPHPLLPQPEEESLVPVYSLGQGRAHNRRQPHGNTRPPLCCAALSLGSPCGGGSPSAPEGNTPLPALLGAPHAGLLAGRTCLPGHSVCRPPSDPPFHTRLSCLWNRWDRHCEQNAMFCFFICLYYIGFMTMFVAVCYTRSLSCFLNV